MRRPSGQVMRLLGTLATLLLAACGHQEDNRSRKTEISMDPPAAAGAMAPNLAAGSQGTFMTWLEPAGTAGDAEHRLRLSRLVLEHGTPQWSRPVTVAQNSNFFVNWADFPTVAEATDGSLLAHWLARSSAGRYSYDVQLARSGDGGARWTMLGPVNRDGTPSEHGFVSMLPQGDGIRVFWLDGRQTVEVKKVSAPDATAQASQVPPGAMSLRTALVRESPGEDELLDPRVCDCCQTAAALTAGGPVVVYRDRSLQEIRDISIIRWTPAGWSGPAPVHNDSWTVPGCPVNGPAVASLGANSRQLAVAWFTAPENTPQVLVAFSSDAGATFSPPVRVDSGRPLGRVSVVMDPAGHAFVAWLEAGQDDDAWVRVRRIRPGTGPADPVPASLTVSRTSQVRASGFPRLLRVADELLVAWTEATKPSHIRTRLVPLSDLEERPAATGTDRPPASIPQQITGRWSAEPGAPLPSYTAWSLDDEPVDLAVPAGRAVLINFWATWCVPCVAETQELIQLHHQYNGQGLQIIGVNMDGPATAARVSEFMTEHAIPYTILKDRDDAAYRRFDFQSLPGNFLFDAAGRLAWAGQGALNRHDPEFTTALKAALGSGAMDSIPDEN